MGIDPVTHAPRLDLLDLSSLLNSPQLNMSNLLRLHRLVNPGELGLALCLLSSHAENPDILLQKLQENQLFNSQLVQSHRAPVSPPNQVENIIQQRIIPSSLATSSFHDQFQSSQGDMAGHFSGDNTNSVDQIFKDNIAAPPAGHQSLPLNLPSFCHGISDLSDNWSSQSLDLSNNNNSSQNFSFDSILSALLSSPAPLDSALGVASGCTVVGRESFCSNLLEFEIPESGYIF